MALAQIAAVLLALATQAPGDTTRRIDLHERYSSAFHLRKQEYEGHPFFDLHVDSLPASDPLARLINPNRLFFNYIAAHGTHPELPQLIASARDKDAIPAAFDLLLVQDSAFNAVMVATAGRFLAPSATSVIGYDRRRPRPSFTMDEVVSVAVRFFYPDSILPDGRVQTHVCIGINGVSDLQRGRDIAVEAFVYSAIMKELKDNRHGLDSAYQRAAHRLNRLDLSSDNRVRLIRSQGALWTMMAQSPALRETLWADYRAQRSFLPFSIVPARPGQ